MSFAKHLAAAKDLKSFYHGFDACIDELELYTIECIEAGDVVAARFVTDLAHALSRRYRETAAALRKQQTKPPQKRKSKVLSFREVEKSG